MGVKALSENILDQFDYVRKKVREILRDYPEANKDSILLLIKYWEKVDGIRITIPLSVRSNMTKPATILRRVFEIRKEREGDNWFKYGKSKLASLRKGK